MENYKHLKFLLIRRAKYFNKVNGGKINIEALKKITTQKQFDKYNDSLIKKRKQYNVKKQKQRELLKFKATKNKKDDFKKKLNKYLDNSSKYNNSQGAGKYKNRINLVPKNENEIKKYTKILNTLKDGNISKARKLLKAHKGESILEATRRISGNSNYKSAIYYKTCLREAQKYGYDTLVKIIVEGGIDMLNELAEFNFTIIDFVYMPEGYDDYDDVLNSKLMAIARRMSSKNRQIIEKVVEDKIEKDRKKNENKKKLIDKFKKLSK